MTAEPLPCLPSGRLQGREEFQQLVRQALAWAATQGCKELLLSDVLGTDSDVVMRPIEADVDRQLLQTAVSHLSPRERDIITMRFGLGGIKELTQKEVADRLGISQSYISRLEKRIIARLKRELQKLA